MTERFDEIHSALKGFTEYYEREIAPWLAEQETARRRALTNAIVIMVIAVLAGAALLFSGLDKFAPLAAAAAVGFGAIFAWRGVQQVRDSAKSFVMERICAFLGLDYRNEPQTSALELFRELGLVPAYDRCHMEDQITGTRDGVEIALVEANLKERRTHTDSKGRTRTHYVTVFQGLLMRFTFPKRFSGRTIVVQDKGWLGKLFSSWGIPGERVALEDPRFEEIFEVYGSDQVEARYLLTPTFMERLLDLARHFGERSLALAFENQALLISLRTGSDQFEAGTVFRSLGDPRQIQRVLNEICAIFNVIDLLRLRLKTRA